MEADLWLSLEPNIRRFVETLIKNGKVGICAGNIRVFDISSSCLSIRSQPKGDRFTIILPYAGKSVTWEVLFDCNYPEDPPDFIFGPEDKDFCPNIEDVQADLVNLFGKGLTDSKDQIHQSQELLSLVDWNAENPDSLLLVIRDLLDHYKRHQQKLIDDSSRLKFEYTALIDQTELQPSDIEVFVCKTETRVGPINFLLKLPVDFSKIPPYLLKENPGPDTAVLLVSFSNPEANRASPQLMLSPRVEHALGGVASLRIPPFPSGGCLIDYVPNVCQLLQNKVDQISMGFSKRKEYLAAFMKQFGGSLLEFDAEGFSKISFLFEWNDFFFILHIHLPLYFPAEIPYLTLQSIYHESDRKPYTEIYKEYPYSPRWSGDEMAERARSYILDNIGSFQKSSVMSGAL